MANRKEKTKQINRSLSCPFSFQSQLPTCRRHRQSALWDCVRGTTLHGSNAEGTDQQNLPAGSPPELHQVWVCHWPWNWGESNVLQGDRNELQETGTYSLTV